MVTKSNGNMYPDKDTWNPLAGDCYHNCIYCYRNNWKKRSRNCDRKYSGEIRLWENSFNSLGEGNEIFVCSMTDLFANNVPSIYIDKIIRYCRNYSNTYLFQTKNPRRFSEFIDIFPQNTILGTTIESNRYDENLSRAPSTRERAQWMANLKLNLNDKYKFMVSIEPVIKFDLDKLVTMIRDVLPDYISIGADSKSNGLEEPTKDELKKLIKKLGDFTEVKIKKNINRIIEK